jgi:hypothetical protein
MGVGGIGALMGFKFLLQSHDFALFGFMLALHLIHFGDAVNSFFAGESKICGHGAKSPIMTARL